MDFLFMCEIPTREEEAIVLICEELKKRGYSADYIYWDGMKKKYREKVKVFVTNRVITIDEIARYIVPCVGFVEKVVNLRWEQIYYTLQQERERKDIERLCETSKTFNYFCWGPFYYDRLFAGGINSRYLHKCGNLKMDFLSDEVQNYFESREILFEKYGVDSSKKVVMFVSSFYLVNPTKEDFDRYAQRVGIRYANARMEFEKNTQAQILKWFEYILSNFDEYEIIYRPHPAMDENPKIYSLKDDYKSFHIISDESLQQWIKVVDIVCLINSTSITDCYFAKKRCLTLRPMQLLQEDETVLFKSNKKITTMEEFVYELKNENVINDSAMDEFFYKNEELSYIKWADELEKIIKNSQYNVVWDNKERKQIGELSKRYRKKYKRIERTNIIKNALCLLGFTKFKNKYYVSLNLWQEKRKISQTRSKQRPLIIRKIKRIFID